jgi:spermidine synthase
MARPWQTVDKVETADGVLELRKRGERDFLILINGRVLMNSRESRSEHALGEQTCRAIAARPAPRVLIGGLGMGLTLRAALDALPPSARVVVSELNPAIIHWCRGPLGEPTSRAIDDPRVEIEIEDCAQVIARSAQEPALRYDAILIDLYEGPGAGTDPVHDPFYGSRALARTGDALLPAGIFAVWGEAPDRAFERRLRSAGFRVTRRRPGRGGLRHVLYQAVKA